MLSTVLIKQHFTPDILGGLALAWLCDRLAALLVKKKPAKGAVRQEIDRTGPKPGNERAT